MCNFLINSLLISTFPFNEKVVNEPDFHWTKDDKRKIKLGFKTDIF